jgi:hypothetical protein
MVQSRFSELFFRALFVSFVAGIMSPRFDLKRENAWKAFCAA